MAYNSSLTVLKIIPSVFYNTLVYGKHGIPPKPRSQWHWILFKPQLQATMGLNQYTHRAVANSASMTPNVLCIIPYYADGCWLQQILQNGFSIEPDYTKAFNFFNQSQRRLGDRQLTVLSISKCPSSHIRPLQLFTSFLWWPMGLNFCHMPSISSCMTCSQILRPQWKTQR